MKLSRTILTDLGLTGDPRGEATLNPEARVNRCPTDDVDARRICSGVGDGDG